MDKGKAGRRTNIVSGRGGGEGWIKVRIVYYRIIYEGGGRKWYIMELYIY